MLQQNSQTVASPIIDHSAAIILQAIFAVMLGLSVVGFAGFSHLDAIHDAAHDTRHSNSFPCH